MTTTTEQNQNDQPSDDAPSLVKITVSSCDYSIDLKTVATDVTAERVLWWANLLSVAEEELAQLERNYRVFRATTTVELLLKIPKISEWKVRAQIESNPRFSVFKGVIAENERAVNLLRELVAVIKR